MIMNIATQIAVFLQNRPGTLARVCQALRDAKINIHALSTGDTVDYNVVRMIVNDTARALQIFQDHNTLTITNEVLMIECSNKPGALVEISEKLSKAHINIEYCYSATPPKSKNGLLIIRTSDQNKALKTLNN